MSGAVARRYTQGLFDYARDHGLVDAVDTGLQVIADALKQSSAFKTLFEHPLISPEDKARMLTEVFGAAVDPVVIRFVNLLFARNRSEYLADIYESFHAAAEEMKGLVSIRLETAFELTEAQVEQLQQALSQALNKQARAIVEVNPELIAGYRVHVGNRVMDATVRGTLEQFSEKLMEQRATGRTGA